MKHKYMAILKEAGFTHANAGIVLDLLSREKYEYAQKEMEKLIDQFKTKAMDLKLISDHLYDEIQERKEIMIK